MITKDTRNKFSSRSFAPKPKMPYRPNIWLKLNLQRIKANMTKEELAGNRAREIFPKKFTSLSISDPKMLH